MHSNTFASQSIAIPGDACVIKTMHIIIFRIVELSCEFFLLFHSTAAFLQTKIEIYLRVNIKITRAHVWYQSLAFEFLVLSRSMCTSHRMCFWFDEWWWWFDSHRRYDSRLIQIWFFNSCLNASSIFSYFLHFAIFTSMYRRVARRQQKESQSNFFMKLNPLSCCEYV